METSISAPNRKAILKLLRSLNADEPVDRQEVKRWMIAGPSGDAKDFLHTPEWGNLWAQHPDFMSGVRNEVLDEIRKTPEYTALVEDFRKITETLRDQEAIEIVKAIGLWGRECEKTQAGWTFLSSPEWKEFIRKYGYVVLNRA